MREKNGSLYFTTRKIEYQRTKQSVEREINQLSRYRLRKVRIFTYANDEKSQLSELKCSNDNN